MKHIVEGWFHYESVTHKFTWAQNSSCSISGMEFIEASIFTKMDIAGRTPEARLDGSSRYPSTFASPAQVTSSLSPLDAHQWMSGECVTQSVLATHSHERWWCHCLASIHPRIGQFVNELHLECFQLILTTVGWQRPVAQPPQCECVDDADVEDAPEQVLPPS